MRLVEISSFNLQCRLVDPVIKHPLALDGSLSPAFFQEQGKCVTIVI
jgi:hypothetical protein